MTASYWDDPQASDLEGLRRALTMLSIGVQDPSAYDQASSTANVLEVGLRRWRAGNARQRCGAGPAHVVVIGNSTVAGVGATPGQERTQSPPGRMIQALAGRLGTGAVVDGHATPASYFANGDPTKAGFTLGSGWAQYGDGGTPMSGIFYANAGAAGTLDYVPKGGINWDTAIVVFSTQQGFTADAWIDSGAHTTVTAGQASALIVRTIAAASPGQRTLHVGNVASGQVRVVSAAVYDSTQPQSGIMVTNFGLSGTTAADWNGLTEGASTTALLAAVKPDMTFINLGINDAKPQLGTTPAAYETSVRGIAAAAFAAGSDVGFIVPQQYDPAGAVTYGDHSSLDKVLYAIAKDRSVPVVDLARRWGSFAEYTADYGGYPHPNARGYANEGQVLANLLVRTS